MKKLVCVCAALMLMLCGCDRREEPSPAPVPASLPAATASAEPTAETVPSVKLEAFSLPLVLETDGGDSVLSVYDAETGNILQMSAEDYLCAVVAGEMPQDFSEQALMAQSVVARTFLVRFLTEKGHSSVCPEADISTDVEESQAFRRDAVSEKVRKAVADTRGMILVYEGDPIRAWFHASSGGRTAGAEEGLSFTGEPTPYLVSAESPETDVPPEIEHWSADFTREEVEAALSSVLGKSVPFTSVREGERGESGRLTNLVISDVSVPVNELRLALGSTKFRSALVTGVSLSDGGLHLEGKGYGHGVGMSQWGAETLARQGKTWEEILSRYYVGTELVRAWS